MVYSQEVQHMCVVKKGPNHGPAPIPEEGKWVKAKEIKDISGLTHGIGWCAPQQGTCKLTLNIKEGVIEEALVETIGCSGMTHSAAMAAEILPGKTILEALNTDLVCDAINTAMRELFLQIVYGHVFGMVYDFLYGFSAGAHLYFLTRMPSPKIIAQSFSEIKPRVISCVPLIVEKIIKKNILPLIDNKIGKLLLRMPIVNDKIKADMRKKAMDVFGGNFDEIIIGGAPFNADVERFLKQIGFPYTIAYGMTECGPIICSSRWETLKLASCGKATTRMEVKIDSPDPQHVAGEIICRGTNLMLGYYKNAEATSQIIDVNGWLHTGDLATMDADGYVTVRGRSKNMLLTSSGQNIYPEEIESKLNNMPYVSESLIVLQHDKLVALIYPDFDDAFAHGLQQADIEKVMEANRNELNQLLPAYCQITKVKIHFEEFEKTAKKSIKRFMYQEAKG